MGRPLARRWQRRLWRCYRKGHGYLLTRKLTIVYNDAGNAEGLLHSVKSLDHVFSLGEVARNVQLTFGAVCFFDGASGEADFVSLGGEFARNRLPNIGTCANDECDWRSGGHCEEFSIWSCRCFEQEGFVL